MLRARGLLFSLFLLVVVGSGHAAGSDVSRFTFAEPHMGTRFKIIIYAPDESCAKKRRRPLSSA